MADTQYRITGTLRANVREEASDKARVLFQLAPGAIVHADPARTKDGEWLPVMVIRGWVHRSLLEMIDE